MQTFLFTVFGALAGSMLALASTTAALLITGDRPLRDFIAFYGICIIGGAIFGFWLGRRPDVVQRWEDASAERFRQKQKAHLASLPPPWEKPRTVDACAEPEMFEQLKTRLVPLVGTRKYDGREEQFRDRETGQRWQYIYREEEFSHHEWFAPIDG
jgi:hypothetical protein